MVLSVMLTLLVGCGDAAGQSAPLDSSSAAGTGAAEHAGTYAEAPDAGSTVATSEPEPEQHETPPAATTSSDAASDETANAVPEKPREPNEGAKPAADESPERDSSTLAKPEAAKLVNPAPGSKFFVGANFWNIGWQGSEDYFVRGTNFATVENPWRAEFLRDLEPYLVLRFMDWNLTNTNDNAQAHWSSRLKRTDPQRQGVALEWQIDLCNRAQTDCWITVPHESGPEYWTQLAELVHDELDPSLRIYIEWSNEIWNEQFPQRGYARNQGTALGLAGTDKAASFYVHQSVRVFEAFEAVFGKDNPRVVKVIAGQAAWSGPCEAHLAALADPKINPNRTRASAYAIAPYPTGHSISELRASLRQVASWVQENASCASKAELPLITYEGGTDSFGSDNGQACRSLQRDPGMRALYTSFLDTMYDAKLLGPFMQYTHSGACWGLKESTDSDLASSPKYQALLDWTAAHP